MRQRTIVFGMGPLVGAGLAGLLGLFLESCSGGHVEIPPASDAGKDGAAPKDGSAKTTPCTAFFPEGGSAGAVTITVDPKSVVNTFVPKLLFGINSAYFISQQDSTNTQAMVQAAGNYSIRYPGGSSSDDYHWNGTGTYDANQRWVPSSTSYTPGFPGTEIFRGTTSVAYGISAMITDGKTSTRWISNTDTAFPTAQWVYVDLAQPTQVTSLKIDWATPYATSFQVQTWTSSSSYPAPYQASGGTWQTLSSGVVLGTGGSQTVTFSPVTAQFVRVLMTASSAGAGGAYSIAELTAYNGTTQVTVNDPSTRQSPTVASSTDPANVPAPQTNFDFESFMAYARSFTPPADPVITVNVGTGTPGEAAAWVHYANVVKKYGIRYWQIGNEMEGVWETGGPLNAQDYVQRYVEYYDAMKAEDPSIMILGPVSGGPTEPSNLPDGKLFVQDFIDLLHAAGKDDHINAIDFHWYPNWKSVSDDTALTTTSQLGTFSTSLHAWLSGAGVTSNVPVFLTEYNIGLGSPNEPVYVNQLVNGLWVANSLGEFIRYFGNGGGTNLWMMLGGVNVMDPTAGDLGYLQQARDGYRYQPHATYWAMQMMSSDFAIGGDDRTHKLVSSTSTQPLLPAYADLRPDGALTVAVINKNEGASYTATLDLGTFATGTLADVWTFGAENYVWELDAAPYHAAPDTPPTHHLTCGAGARNAFEFPPASITVFRFAPPGAPTATIPDASTANTGFDPLLIDDMSSTSGAQVQFVPEHAGDFAGFWYTYIGGGSSPADTGWISPPTQAELTDGGTGAFYYTPIAGSIPPVPDGGTEGYAACASGQTPANQWAYAAEGFTFELTPTSGGSKTAFVDLTAHKGLQFWVYNALPTSTTIQLQVADKESEPSAGICGHPIDGSTLYECYSPVYQELTVPPGWSFQRAPFSALRTNPYFGYQQPPGGDMANVSSVNFQVNQPTADAGALPFDFCVTDLRLFN